MASTTLREVLELAELLRPAWPAISREIPSWHPRNEDPAPDPAPDPKPDPAPDPKPDPAADPAPDPKPDPAPDPDPGDDPEKLREELRKHRGTERRAKEAEKRLREAEARLKELEDAEKTDQEKAIEQARTEAAAEIETKYETERRDDRIENAVTKLAARGFTVKDGEEDKTLRFADPDDAQLRLERALRKGELSYDDIYVDGAVQTNAVSEFLTDLLRENAHLRASGSEPPAKPDGGADAGRGDPPKTGELGVEGHLEKVRRNKS